VRAVRGILGKTLFQCWRRLANRVGRLKSGSVLVGYLGRERGVWVEVRVGLGLGIGPELGLE
jgi:hypothetical protein